MSRTRKNILYFIVIVAVLLLAVILFYNSSNVSSLEENADSNLAQNTGTFNGRTAGDYEQETFYTLNILYEDPSHGSLSPDIAGDYAPGSKIRTKATANKGWNVQFTPNQGQGGYESCRGDRRWCTLVMDSDKEIVVSWTEENKWRWNGDLSWGRDW